VEVRSRLHTLAPVMAFWKSGKSLTIAGYRNTIFLLFGSYPSNITDHLILAWAEITQTVQRLDTGWTVRGWNFGVDEIFRTLGPTLPTIQWVSGFSRR